MIETVKDAADELSPEFVLSRRSGLANRPKDFEWVAKNIPCQAACPAGTDIPGYLDAIAQGGYEEAYRINVRDNVFPAVLGRVCTRPCEPACRHGWEGLGEPVAICFSKRSAETFMQDQGLVALDPIFPATGKSIGIIGAGAAGLAAARQLALYGHGVIVYEQHTEPGGMMVQGIPDFRLPRALVSREIRQIEACGVDIRCGVSVGRDVTLDALLHQHDAVILAAGTLRPTLPDLPGADLAGVRHGLVFLRDVNRGAPVEVGARTVVIGGGFTAVDCARMAKRLGSETVGAYYRRSKQEMYITGGEIDEMEREHIAFHTMSIPLGFTGTGGRVTHVRFARAELGPPDESGRRRPVPIEGSEIDVPADTVLLCTGQTPDMTWIDGALTPKVVDRGEAIRRVGEHQTSVPHLYVAGDYATGAVSLIDAIGHAKACARRIDEDLIGDNRLVDVVRIEDAEATGRTREMDAIPRQSMPTLPIPERGLGREVETGFDDSTARTEASRCYLCHYKFEIDNDLCIYCDRCLKVKPVEQCIIKVNALEFSEDGRIAGARRSTGSRNYNLLFIDQNECIRCGACAEVCPVECITLQRVSSDVVGRSEL
jgi:formate dehydrogenase major subunit